MEQALSSMLVACCMKKRTKSAEADFSDLFTLQSHEVDVCGIKGLFPTERRSQREVSCCCCLSVLPKKPGSTLELGGKGLPSE
jgi:hypothetical protein